MTTELIETFANYGIAGAIIVVLIIYLNQREKQHSKERDSRDEKHADERNAWRIESNSHVEKFANVIKESTEALTIIHGAMKGQDKALERIEENTK